MTRKRRMFDIDLPETEAAGEPAAETFPAGKDDAAPRRRGPSGPDRRFR